MILLPSWYHFLCYHMLLLLHQHYRQQILVHSHLTTARVVFVSQLAYCFLLSSMFGSLITVGLCCKNSGPHFHHFTLGLLQLSCFRHYRQYTLMITGDIERCSMPSHWQSQLQTYHSIFATAPLVTSSVESRI